MAGLASTALVAGILSVAAPPAGATTVLTDATATTTTQVDPNASTQLGNMTVSGSGTLDVTLATDLGTVSVPGDGTNLTLAYANDWLDQPSVTFSGTAADINAALAAAQLNEGFVGGQTAHVSLTVLPAQDGALYDPANQHFYEYVNAPGISWTDARTAAAQLPLLGQMGYLASLPTAEVNDFVTSKLEGARNVWFGAESTDTPLATPGRSWAWSDGPLAGTVFTTCDNFYSYDWWSGCFSETPQPGWAGWAPGEPNNAGADYNSDSPHTGEWVAVTGWGAPNEWNDVRDGWDSAQGYIVEFGDRPIGATNFSGVTTVSADVQVNVGPPAPPTDVAATAGNGKATISFTPGADNGSPITGYTVNAYDGATKLDPQECAASGCEVTGLTNGTSYAFTVQAVNEAGTGGESAPSDAVTPVTVPGAPTDVTAVRGNASAEVSFSAPASDGGATILSYTVTSSRDDISVTCSDSPCLVGGLANGWEYTFVVRATNAVGDGADSDASNAVTPATVPDAPVVDTLEPENALVKVSFHDGESNGGSAILHYVVRVFDGEDEAASQQCDGSPCTVEGLANGASYTATVEAVNDTGTGASSDHTIAFVPSTVPDAPANLQVTRGDGQLTLTFDPAADNGSSITSYQVSLNGGDSWSDIDASGDGSLSAVVAELANGTTYHVAVRAVNGRGNGPASTPVQDGTPATVPGAPTHVGTVRTGNSGEVSVSWQAPASDGGDAVTGYEVTASAADSEPITIACASSPCTVGDLENGMPYVFRVRAKNSVGFGPDSDPSTAATPATTPDAPRNLQVVSDNGALQLTFDAPEWNGGDAVTGFEVTTDSGEHWAALTTNHTVHYTATVPSLTNGTAYPVRVRAVNGVGAGTATDSVSGTPASMPGAPRNVAVHRAGTNAVVSWTPPASTGGAPIVRYVAVASPGAVQCVSLGTSCTFAGLSRGVTYTFTVRADNADADLPATGSGPAGASSPLLLEGRPGAPRGLSVHGGDRRLTVAFRTPADDGGAAITAYRVSLDGGRHWISVRSPRSVEFDGVRNGATYRVVVRAVNRDGAGPATAVRRFTVPTWFHDPISAKARAAELAVPAHPQHYRGAVRTTTAAARAFDGTPAFPVQRIDGRQLQGREAAALGTDALFAFDSATLNAAGRAVVRRLAQSLRYVRKVTCEGYSDFGGAAGHQRALSTARARAVCGLLRASGVRGELTVRGYGASRPVLVGGRPVDRAANRRVIVLARG